MAALTTKWLTIGAGEASKYTFTTDYTLSEQPMAPEPKPSFIFVGDKVQVKKSVEDPVYGWGNISHKNIGIVVGIGAEVEGTYDDNILLISFPTTSFNSKNPWKGHPPEMKIVKKAHPAWWYQSLEAIKKKALEAKYENDKCIICGKAPTDVVTNCSHLFIAHCGDCCTKYKDELISLPPHICKPKPPKSPATKPEGGTIACPPSDAPKDTVPLKELVGKPIKLKDSLVAENTYILWELEEWLPLSRVAADFYTLIDLSQDYPYNEEVSLKLALITSRLSQQFSSYLNMAIGGELRYLREVAFLATWQAFPKSLLTPTVEAILGNLPATTRGRRPRKAEWRIWKNLQETTGALPAIEAARDLFRAKGLGWQGSIGGTKWANAAKILVMYLKGELTGIAFVDTTFGLQHNGNIIFDKIWNVRDLGSVLNYSLQGETLEVLRWASEDIKRINSRLRK